MFAESVHSLELTKLKEEKMSEERTLAKLCMEYFGESRKITTTEYKELTRQDREELREEFIKMGVNVAPLPVLKTE